MKLQIKPLFITLGLAALLGACSSVNSSNPSVEEPALNDGIEFESSDGINGVEEIPNNSTEIETYDLEASDSSAQELESAEMQTPEFEASEEFTTDMESAEMQTPELEASEELNTDMESAEMQTPELETAEQETPELEASEIPLEPDNSEVVFPLDDAAQTTTESEAADNSTLELEPAQ